MMSLLAIIATSAYALAPPIVQQQASTGRVLLPETMQQCHLQTGVYAGSAKIVQRVPGLCSWRNWYTPPAWLTNGHVHTIWASMLRSAPSCRYGRVLLTTPDGGSLALDLLEDVWTDESPPRVIIHERSETAMPNTRRPFALLLSGLGGGSQDSYVRSMGAYAKARGFDVGVLNMRSCGDSPVTSPRFFSAYLGSTDDVALAVDAIRAHASPSSVVAIGWSNSGTIVINTLAGGHAKLDAACALAAPLNMPVSSANLRRVFHRNVYDRNIGSSLSSKFRKHRSYFEDADGRPKPVPAYRAGDTFVADVEKAAAAMSIRAIDEALTAPCFGFETVDDYYEFSSSHQRIDRVQTPLLLVNAADDPIALWGDFDRLVADVGKNPNLVFVATAHGGHLGWCDADDPRGEPKWIQRCAVDFLLAALE